MIFSEGSWANISAAKQIEPNQVFKWPGGRLKIRRGVSPSANCFSSFAKYFK